MKIDTMRRIDRRAGIPLCAVATMLLHATAWLRWRSARPARRILFVELSEMGTTVLAEPAMRKTRQQLSAELFFVTFTRNAASIAGQMIWVKDSAQWATCDRSGELFATASRSLESGSLSPIRHCRDDSSNKPAQLAGVMMASI